ncbi:Nn.00g097670.m01.CDS01 [Neocucurbitaria sp. VM-36]
MATNDKKLTTITIERRSSKDSLEVKTPRTARFAEATSVYSPVDAPRSPFEYPTNHYKPQPQVSDVGFGYMQSVEMEETDRKYLPPPTPKTPGGGLKSALKSPGAPPRTPGGAMSILSPTFREEQQLEKREAFTEKEQAKDLKIKVRVRVAKIFLRGINFACSLIVLSMVATAFAIFNATKHLPKRNGLPAWAENTKVWPQILLLSIACISMFMSVVVMIAYFRGGHRRAEKVAAYYTVFAVGFFIFSIIMWAVGAAIFNQSKAQNNNKDMWGWSCVDNKRRHLFEDDVSYGLVCRLQNWALVCCIIEVVIEVLCITIYGIVFYRFWSKRKLRKSMAMRDRARSDLYLAQLRSQSAPNTPGFGPMSPRSGGWRPPPGHPMYVDPHSAAEAGESDKVQYAYAREIAQPQPFTLSAPPIKVTGATPKMNQDGFESTPSRTSSASPPLPPASPGFQERRNDHVGAAPGEQQYASVPIPGAYTPLASPSYPPPQQQAASFDFGPAVTGRN